MRSILAARAATGCLGSTPGPEHAGIALLEPAGARDAQLEWVAADAGKRVGEVVRDRPLDFADEAQGEVQLLVLLPAEVGAVVHRIDQQVADVLGRSDGDEQAVHG